METRQEKLLKLIVENYIATAEPVGSKFLVETCELEISDATVRNEMRDLEEAGYLTHPHTSAGRIPTEAGYHVYVEKLMVPGTTSKKMRAGLENTVAESAGDDGIKQVSKTLAEEMQSAVIVAFDLNRVYYTGLSGLFSQPEFHDNEYTINASEMFDRAEELVGDLFDRVPFGASAILVGSQNPLGAGFSMVSARLPNDALVNIMGPLRMDYRKGQSLIETVLEIFNR